MTDRNPSLVAAGSLSLAAAALHLALIAGGGDWYRFFGAGEGIARAAERGSPVPALMTVAIAAILGLWAAYAFSGAGLIRRLPLIRTGLIVISAIYLVRGLLMFLPLPADPSAPPGFMLWSSLIVLLFGFAYAFGTWRAWPHLSKRKSA